MMTDAETLIHLFKKEVLKATLLGKKELPEEIEDAILEFIPVYTRPLYEWVLSFIHTVLPEEERFSNLGVWRVDVVNRELPVIFDKPTPALWHTVSKANRKPRIGTRRKAKNNNAWWCVPVASELEVEKKNIARPMCYHNPKEHTLIIQSRDMLRLCEHWIPKGDTEKWRWWSATDLAMIMACLRKETTITLVYEEQQQYWEEEDRYEVTYSYTGVFTDSDGRVISSNRKLVRVFLNATIGCRRDYNGYKYSYDYDDY